MHLEYKCSHPQNTRETENNRDFRSPHGDGLPSLLYENGTFPEIKLSSPGTAQSVPVFCSACLCYVILVIFTAATVPHPQSKTILKAMIIPHLHQY